jgi:proteasome accessory factor B
MQFGYQNFEMIEQPRSVVPLSISSRDGHWYFSGIDQDLQEMRTFRFDRVSSEFTIRKTPKDFELPDDLSQNEVLNSQQTAILDVRRGKGIALRSISVSQEHLGEWDRIKIPLYDIKSMVALILWHGEDVFVHEPVGLCEAVVESLRALVTTHG